MPLSPIPSTLPTSTYEHLVLEALSGIAGPGALSYHPPILSTAEYRHLVLTALQYIANNPGATGTVTSITAGAGLTGGTITTAGTISADFGNTANTICEGDDSRLSDSRTPSGTAGGDLSGTYPNPTVDALQGNAVSNATPYNGQVLQFDGTSWVPGAIPSGGSGGGGVVYFLNFNTAADAPLTNIPQTPNATKELGILGDVTGTSYQSPTLSTASYDFLASFVTDLTVPGATSIPAGIWDFNIFVESTTTNSANQIYFKIEIRKYDGVNTPTLLATSNDIYIYDPSEINQYVASVVMPQTTILDTDRIVVYLYGRAHQNNNQLTFHFGGNYPSHTHSTMPSVTGSGVVKVVNGVFQSPASQIVNADISASAAIDVSKLSGVVAKAGDTMTGKLNLPAVTTVSAPLSLGSANTDPTSPAVGDMWIAGNNLKYRGSLATPTIVAGMNRVNTFSSRQVIEVTENSNPALRVTQLGTGEALRVEDETNPDSTAFVVNGTGKVGIGVAPDTSVCLSLDSTGVKFSDGTIQTTSGVAKTGDTMTGKLNLPASTTASAPLNLGSGVSPTTTIAGDVFASGNNIFFKGTTGGPYIFAYKNDTNTFLLPQIISTTSPTGDSTPALRITQAGGGEALRVEDSTTPDSTAFVVSTSGKVGIGVTPDASVCLSLDATGVKFSDGSIQKTAMQPYTVVEHFLQGNLSLNNLRNLTGGGGSSSSAVTARQYNSTGVVTVVTGTNAVIAHSAMGIDQVNENAVDLSQASKNIFSSRAAFFTLPDASATGMWYSGFVDNYNVVSTNGAYFRIVNAGNLEAVCVSAGVETMQPLGFRPATGAMHLYEVIARDNGTAVDFWYDGSLVATIISNIPTGNTQRVNYAAGIMRLSTVVTTSLEFDLDLVFVRLYNTGFTLKYE